MKPDRWRLPYFFRFALKIGPMSGLGIKEVDDGIWLVTFMNYNLGYIDLEQRTLQTVDNPFGTRSSPMSQVRSITHVSGLDKEVAGRGGGI